MSASYDQITGLPTFYRQVDCSQPLSPKTPNEVPVWTMCAPEERKNIALRCYEGHLLPNTSTGLGEGYYEKSKKHDPYKQIPAQIYTLTPGTVDTMVDEYNQMYEVITRRHFLNYFRELKKQQIIIRSD